MRNPPGARPGQSERSPSIVDSYMSRVQPDDRPGAIGDRRQRVGEEPFEEADALVEQAQARERCAHLVGGHGEQRLAMPARAGVRRVRLPARRRQPGEGVGEVDETVAVVVDVERRAHEHRDAAAPRARLDEIARHALGQHGLHAAADVAQTLDADHRVGEHRPVPADLADRGVTGRHAQRDDAGASQRAQDAARDRVAARPADVELGVRRVRERLLEQIEVASPRVQAVSVPAGEASGCGSMAHVIASDLAYAHPGGDLLFRNVSFRVSGGRKVGVVGANGIGKSTLFGVLSGALAPEEGDVSIGGRLAYMRQDVGVAGEARTVRELLTELAPGGLRSAGERMADAERRMAAGDDDAAMEFATAIGDWSELGGYELQGQWDAACRRIVRSGFDELAERPAVTLSGGERKRLVLDVLFASDADVLLLDEPDNFLDVAGQARARAPDRGLEEDRAGHLPRPRAAVGRGVLDPHDRGRRRVDARGLLRDLPAAREERQRKLGDAVKRWKDEERRLFALMKTFKERARYSSDWAKKADAAETRWRRFADGGPPPAPVADQQIKMRIRGADSARKALVLKEVGIDGLVAPFSDEVHLGERVGLIGPNGGGKTQLMRAFAGETARAQRGGPHRQPRLGRRLHPAQPARRLRRTARASTS